MNEIGLNFEPLFPFGLVLAFFFVVLSFLFWLELKKKQKLVTYRFVALLLMAISVIGLVLRPSFSSEQKQGVILLTRGYDKGKVDSVLKLTPDLKIVSTKSAEPFPKSQSLSASSLDRNNIKYIFGEGLPEYSFEEFSHPSFDFLPAPFPEGIVELKVPEVFSDRTNSLSGIFHAEHRTKLKLIGPTGPEDSTLLDKKKNSFALSFIPKQPGLFIYYLVSENSLGQKTSERLPIEVNSATKLRVLLLQDFPSIEFRHLKSFLTESGHSLVVRTRVSKTNFIEEFINMPRSQVKNISAELLNSFDVLLADSKTIENLAVYEKSILAHAIQNGLGFMIVPYTPSREHEFYSIVGKRISTDTARFRIRNKSYVLPALPLDIKVEYSVKSIFKNRKRILAGYRLLGAGKIGFQLLQETYRLRQEGNGSDYATMWSTLIEKISRRKTKNFELKLTAYFPYYMDEPIPFAVISSGKTPELFADGIKIPLREDVIIDDYWHGKTWAGNPGWHQLRATDSATLNYFVHQPSEWSSLRAAYSTKQTQIACDRPSQKQAPFTEHRLVPPLVFYIIFLFASGFLWLMPKI